MRKAYVYKSTNKSRPLAAAARRFRRSACCPYAQCHAVVKRLPCHLANIHGVQRKSQLMNRLLRKARAQNKSRTDSEVSEAEYRTDTAPHCQPCETANNSVVEDMNGNIQQPMSDLLTSSINQTEDKT